MALSKGYSSTIESEAENFTYKGNALVRNPDFSPFTQWKNATWIWMIPLKLENQNTGGRGGNITIGGENRPTFAFLSPTSISENITHSWEGFDSIQSRLMGKVVAGAKLVEEAAAMKNGMKKIINAGSQTDLGQGKIQSMTDAAINQAGSITGSDVPKFKVDTPLRYMNSARREIVLEFILMSSAKNVVVEGSSAGARGRGQTSHSKITEVNDIVKDLMMYSSPAIKEGSTIEYEFPYIWRLETVPKGFIVYNFCALTSVQPTWNAPYINGYPTWCNISLTFKDLSPLFRSTIKGGSAINVVDNSDITGFTEEQWAAKFEDLKASSNKKDTIRALLNARSKFKRLQSLHKSIASGNQASVLKYFGGKGTDQLRKLFDSDLQKDIADGLPIGKNTPSLISKFPRL